MSKVTSERFWEKVDKSGGCWLWTAGIYKDGYGQFQYKLKMVAAHRYSWELHFGEIPEGLQVLHKCDTRNCIRPEHLFLGTNQDNVDDKVSKGRQHKPKGVLHGRSKLDDNKVRCIRRYYPMFTQRDLAKFFNVYESTINKVVHYITWKHVK